VSPSIRTIFIQHNAILVQCSLKISAAKDAVLTAETRKLTNTVNKEEFYLWNITAYKRRSISTPKTLPPFHPSETERKNKNFHSLYMASQPRFEEEISRTEFRTLQLCHCVRLPICKHRIKIV
jgi:hypothetical protein